ncbi:MAG: hypothetical protein QXR42_06240 [Candidatus Bathyarchaeia archaeon]
MQAGLTPDQIISKISYYQLLKMIRHLTAVSNKEEKWTRKKLVSLVVFIFIIGFLIGWFSRCYFFPCSWAKTSLTVSAVPESQVRGQTVTFAGALGGEDIANKTILLHVTNPSGAVIKTFNATTNNDGFYSYSCVIPADCLPGKYTVVASYETLTAQANFFVKLAAPQEHGK